ncbi:MAG: response regulator [Betaproteobacteria bacterium]
MLVVDDERDTLIALRMLLQDEGHEVRMATSANGMWRVLNTFDADVVLLDIGLPDGNGYDVARQLRSRYGRRPSLIAARSIRSRVT